MLRRIVTLLCVLLCLCAASLAEAGEDQLPDIGLDLIRLPSLQAGDSVFMGRWRQAKEGSGNDRIEWYVLAVEGRGALLLSRYGLHRTAMNLHADRCVWADTELRAWMNGEFLRGAFTQEERQAILLTRLDNGPDQCDPEHLTQRSSADVTEDYIFALSYAQAEQYLTDPMLRRCVPSRWARARGCNYSNDNGINGAATCWWWLRSPLYNNNFSVIDAAGRQRTSSMTHSYGVARPAMWVDLTLLGY